MHGEGEGGGVTGRWTVDEPTNRLQTWMMNWTRMSRLNILTNVDKEIESF